MESSAGSDDALAALRARLQELHLRQGRPSYRKLAAMTAAMSQTTAHTVIKCERVPRWGNLELLVEAMAGDVEEFRELWVAADVEARAPEALPPRPTPVAAAPAQVAKRFSRRETVALSAAATFAVAGSVWRWTSSRTGADPARPMPPPRSRAGTPFDGPLPDHAGTVWAVAAGLLGGRTVALVGREDGTLRLYDLASGARLGAPLTGHTKPVYAVALGTVRARPVAVSSSVDGTVRLWDLAATPPTGTILGGGADTGAICGAALGTLRGRPVAVSAGDDGTVRLWDLTAVRPAGEVLGSRLPTAVKAVAIATLGSRTLLASGGDDHAVRLWDLSVPRPAPRVLGSHDGPIWSLALGSLSDRDRPFIVSGGDDGTTRVWDLATPDPVGTLLGERLSTAVKAVAVTSLAGATVAVSGGDDGTGRIWDLATGHQNGAPLTGPTTAIEGLSCYRLGADTHVLSGNWTGTQWTWNLGPA